MHLNSWDLIIPSVGLPHSHLTHTEGLGALLDSAVFSSAAHFCDASFPSPIFSHSFQLVLDTPEGQRSGVSGTLQKT